MCQPADTRVHVRGGVETRLGGRTHACRAQATWMLCGNNDRGSLRSHPRCLSCSRVGRRGLAGDQAPGHSGGRRSCSEGCADPQGCGEHGCRDPRRRDFRAAGCAAEGTRGHAHHERDDRLQERHQRQRSLPEPPRCVSRQRVLCACTRGSLALQRARTHARARTRSAAVHRAIGLNVHLELGRRHGAELRTPLYMHRHPCGCSAQLALLDFHAVATEAPHVRVQWARPRRAKKRPEPAGGHGPCQPTLARCILPRPSAGAPSLPGPCEPPRREKRQTTEEAGGAAWTRADLGVPGHVADCGCLACAQVRPVQA